MNYHQRRKQKNAFLDAVEEALQHAGAATKRKTGRAILIDGAELVPRWIVAGSECRLVLQVKGKLPPHHVGALHLRGFL